MCQATSCAKSSRKKGAGAEVTTRAAAVSETSRTRIELGLLSRRFKSSDPAGDERALHWLSALGERRLPAAGRRCGLGHRAPMAVEFGLGMKAGKFRSS